MKGVGGREDCPQVRKFRGRETSFEHKLTWIFLEGYDKLHTTIQFVHYTNADAISVNSNAR